MAKIIGVGDNVVDKYLDLGLMFPGGNALNVAVLSYRYGADAAYMGVLGEDRAGRHIYETLQKEGIDVSHVRITEGPNAYSEVTLVDGDRVFVGGDPGVSTQLSFTEDDFEYMKKFDLIHTSVYSYIEDELKNLKETGKIVSFDFSDSYEQSYLNKTLPYVDFAFFSGSGKSLEEIKDFQKKVSEQ
uniref:PfkB family carbohydrate kinase n=1 Tax=Tepidanaerobacter syntrophicus TaxID=224999 RepID=UPI0023A7B09E